MKKETHEPTDHGEGEALARLVPRVVVRAPFYAKELGPVRSLKVRSEGCVTAEFDGGIELQFYGTGEPWAALLRKVQSGGWFAADDDV